jgi:hypothetical protein
MLNMYILCDSLRSLCLGGEVFRVLCVSGVSLCV